MCQLKYRSAALKAAGRPPDLPFEVPLAPEADLGSEADLEELTGPLPGSGSRSTDPTMPKAFRRHSRRKAGTSLAYGLRSGKKIREK
jgi:hypothetical protein